MGPPLKKICIVTATRAEYGLLKPLIERILHDSRAQLLLVVTGAHLCQHLGHTIEEIISDKFPIAWQVDLEIAGDSALEITKATGRAAIGFAEAFNLLQPDVVVLLGDRYELLPVAQAALIARIPIAHIHGGEATWGAMDDSIRHALTKMSHLHFTSTKSYRQRLIAMGEHPSRVHFVGALVQESLASLKLLPLHQMESDIEIQLTMPFFLITYHPETLLDQANMVARYQAFLAALKHFKNHVLLFTGVNADPGSSAIAELTHRFQSDNPELKIKIVKNLGQLRYLSLMKFSDAVIGNSSSGILEAHFMGVPAVNVGNRQLGRLQAASVVNCKETQADIIGAIEQATSKHHKAQNLSPPSPYFASVVASEVILETLLNSDPKTLLHKTFFDVSFPEI